MNFLNQGVDVTSFRNLSATEKLLERIRSDAAAPSPLRRISDPMEGTPPFRGKGRPTLGISFSQDAIYMVEACRDRRGKLFTRYSRTELSVSPNLDDSQFGGVLEKALASFAGKKKEARIWVLMGAADVEVRLLSLAPATDDELSVAVYWGLKKELGQELPNDLIYDYALVGRRMDGGYPRLEVVTCFANRKVLDPLRNLFETLGYPLSGITVASFALENLLREGRVGSSEESSCFLYVGDGWSRIDIYYKNRLRLSRDIKTGFNSLVEVMQEEMQAVMRAAGEMLEPSAALVSSIVALVVEGDEARWQMNGRDYAIPNRRVRELSNPVVTRLVRQVERTLEYFALNFKAEPVSQVFLTGEMVRNPRMVHALSRSFALPVKVLNVFQPEDFSGFLSPPDSAWEQDQMIPAAGLALSSGMTPNLYCTWKEKQLARRNRRLTAAICLGGLLVLGLMGGFTAVKKMQTKAQLLSNLRTEEQLTRYSTSLNPEMIRKLHEKVETKRADEARRVERYFPLAVIGEVLRRTPETVLVERVLWERNATGSRQEPCRTELEGRILLQEGGPAMENILAGYALELSRASFVTGTRIRRQILRENGRLLAFTLSVDCHGDRKP
ncbi:hypothetical protein OOT00_10760 [Desulfobotulus sp. H1]|uniref:Competence protein A n=1 Tax=Desulfobotulus pelophilus TaxID=2823377 RepID=A0ABT3NAH2_9BACT|nr:hypothetical protein [Desulfobotulus pelophilus]MCW7754465.1 hypothetical protein [Desulfobotulus pelophilus]